MRNPCNQGHPATEKFKDGHCKICRKERALVRGSGSKTFMGVDCAEGHGRLRYSGNGVCVICSKDRTYAHRIRNPGSSARQTAAWKQRNPDAARIWRAKNRPHLLQKTLGRLSKIKQATPAWADKDRIDEIYWRAARVGACLGVKIHVDHIVPLVSDYVCGLHVPANLQLLPALANVKKANRVWPDMTEDSRHD